MRNHRAPLVAGLVLMAGVSGPSGLQAQTAQMRAKVSDVIPKYQPATQILGPIEIIATDALSDLGDEWTAVFKKFQPDSNMVFRPSLSTAAVKALISGTSLLILTARELTPEEDKAFQAKFGYMPMRIPVCLDANIVFVNKNNPIKSVTMEQLDAIYSKTRLAGAKAPIVVWGDLGLKGEWAKRPIQAYTRAPGTATRANIAETVLLKGEYRPGILDRADASSLAEAVMIDEASIAIGTMSSWYYANKVLSVVPLHGEEARFPNQENVTTSKYPMPRLFYAYLNRTPGKPLHAPVSEVIHFLLSKEGQNAVADSALLPGPPEFITIALKRLNR